MSVARDTVSQSHASASYSASQGAFSWTHTPIGTPKGVLVFVFSISATAQETSVTYAGTTMSLVTGGEANDTATEPGTVRTYFLGSGITPGEATVTVNRTNNATQMWAVCYTVTAGNNTEYAGVLIQEENGTFAARSVNDGSPGTNSVRFAAGYSGGSSILVAATGSTVDASNDLGAYTCTTCYETTAGQGARNVGFTYATSDDRAYVALAIREYVPPPDTAPVLVSYVESVWTSQASSKNSTTQLSFQTGDKIWLMAFNAGTTATWTPQAVTGLTAWSSQGIISESGGSQCRGESWTATATADGTATITVGSSVSCAYGFSVWAWRGSNGFGARVAQALTSAPRNQISLTRNSPHSRVCGGFGDWNDWDPSSAAWIPSGATSEEKSHYSGQYTFGVADWPDQGDAGASTYGLDTYGGSGGPVSNIYQEILGTYVGIEESNVSGGPSLKKMSAGGTGTGESAASGGPILKKMGIAGEGGPSFASGGPVLKKMSPAGTGKGTAKASSGPFLKKMSVAGSVKGVSKVSTGPVLKKMGAGGSVKGVSKVSTGPVLKKMGVASSVKGISKISAGPVLKKMSVAGEVTAIPPEASEISGGPSLKKMGVAGTGKGTAKILTGPSLKKMGVAGTGKGESAAAGGAALKKIVIAGFQAEVGRFDGNIGLKKMGVAGTGKGKARVISGPSLKKMGVAGTGTGKARATGAPALKKISILGLQIQTGQFSGSIGLKKMGAAGTGTGTSDISGGPGLKKIVLAGSGAGISAVSDGPSLKKMVIAGTSTETSEIQGDIGLKKVGIEGYSVLLPKPSDMFIFSML